MLIIRAENGAWHKRSHHDHNFLDELSSSELWAKCQTLRRMNDVTNKGTDIQRGQVT